MNGFKLHNGKQEHQFKLALLTEHHSGILVRTDKTIVKEAMINLMEDLRFFARARRGVDIVWGIATNKFVINNHSYLFPSSSASTTKNAA